MKNVFITGVSGYFGYKLVSMFDQKDDVDNIIGIDIKPPSYTSKKLTFIKHDVRDDMFPILSHYRIDWAIHAAYILPPMHNKSLMEDININGTKNFLNSCAKASIPQIMQCSSTTAYGFHADNDYPLTEDSPLRGNDDFTYSKNKKELELVCKKFKDAHPDISLTIIRPCFVAGPAFDNPLSRHLKKKLVMLPCKTAPFQYIHEDDLVEIIYLLLSKKKDGIYNLAADGTMTFDEMLKILGNHSLRMPALVMWYLNGLAWFLHLSFMSEFPSPAMNQVRYPWIASNEKLKKETGYTFKYTTKEAFEDFAQHVKETEIPFWKKLACTCSAKAKE
jgi:UDP-glucose 4-epimerase